MTGPRLANLANVPSYLRPNPPPMGQGSVDQAMAAQHAQFHAAANARAEVVYRLRKMSALHARHAWERRRSDPIGPHALAYIYIWTDERQPPTMAYQPAIATRMFPDGDDVEDLAGLLYGLCEVAGTYRQQGLLDPRIQMADRCEEMPARATFAGVAVSSLDTHTARWSQVRRDPNMREVNVPGRVWVLLTDYTRMIISRRGADEHADFIVRANAQVHAGIQVRLEDGLLEDDHEHAEIWRWLHRLTVTLLEGSRP